MAENHENSKMLAECDDEPKCPESPSPEYYKIPPDPDPPKGIPKETMETINATKDDAIAAAATVKATAVAAAEEAKESGKAAFESAKRKYQSQNDIRDFQIKNKKVQLYREYRGCLRNYLSPKCPPPSDIDIENDERVPADKKAICIAKLKQDLAKEEVTYLAEVQKSSNEWSVAKNVWSIAQENYVFAICAANAAETQARQVAETTWREAISAALEKLCK